MKNFIAYFWNNFILGCKQSWNFLGVVGLFATILIGLVVGFLFGQKSIGKISLITFVVTVGLWLLVSLFIAIFIVPYKRITYFEKQIDESQKKHSEIISRLQGLRKKGESLLDEANEARSTVMRNLIDTWFQDFQDWKNNIINTLRESSLQEAKWFEATDIRALSTTHIVTQSVRLDHDFAELQEKMTKLDNLINRFLYPTLDR